MGDRTGGRAGGKGLLGLGLTGSGFCTAAVEQPLRCWAATAPLVAGLLRVGLGSGVCSTQWA